MKRLTIFTPTYNRGDLIVRVYRSLCQQTCKNFEWLIVDDGSTDHTRTIVAQWIKDKKINIRYIYQQNGGKMRAHNTGVKNSNTELFLCVDSDDYLVENAVEEISDLWCRVKNEKISGIVALKGYDELTT